MNKVLSFLTFGLAVVAVSLFIFGNLIGHNVCFQDPEENLYYTIKLGGWTPAPTPVKGTTHVLPQCFKIFVKK
ncbi:MAG: hypothetical protein WCO12_02400 [bacterium]